MPIRDDNSRDHAHDEQAGEENDVRHALDELGGDADIFNPRTGEDPGLLELTEDPHERRLKRTTM